MGKKALVIGGSIEGIQAALDLADSQIEVTLVEESLALHLNESDRALLLMPKLLRVINHPNIKVITNANVAQVKGEKGNFKATVVEHPRYVDADICASCERCERACPVDIIMANASNGHKAIHRSAFGLKSVPSAYAIDKEGMPACTAACPAGVNTHGYVALVSKGKFAEALDLVTEAVPFPRVLGRVCSHPCEKNCTRAKVDLAVSICALKRFAADSNSTESSLMRSQNSNGIKPKGPPRVAIIGAGPAGLTAARDLTRLGQKSTVFEALPVPGGMITVGMPRFRLPREVRQADVNDIVRLGIEIKTSTPIGKDLTLEDLKRQGYKAILIATGAHKNQRLGIAGENLSGVIDSIALLQALNLKQPITVGKKVVVIGGGYTAIDSARTAIRLHCERVVILYRRSLEEMPANAEEVAEAQEEGVEIEYLVAPIRIIGAESKVVGVECIRMGLGEADSSGRRRPIPIEGSEFCVEADTVIVAVGQRPDLSFLGEDTALTDGRKHIVIDRHTMATKVPGIFAAGDVSGEQGTLIEAIAAGRRAAISIDRFLRGEELKEERSAKAAPVEVNLKKIFIPPIERQKMPCLPLKDRINNFEEVDLGFAAEVAVREAQRCLNCGGCSECLECERACELDAVEHNSIPQQFELDVDAVIATGSAVREKTGGFYLLASPAPNGDLSQASAIAARVMVDLSKHRPDGYEARRGMRQKETLKPVLSQVHSNPEPRIGTFVCNCGGNISEVVNVPDVINYCKKLPGVIYGGEIGYACNDESAEEIKTITKQHNLTHVVLAACSCCNLGQICFSCSERRIRCKLNLLDYSQPGVSYEFVNIREHCAWAHHRHPAEATDKAKSLIRAAAARAVVSQLPAKRAFNIEKSVLVVGRGPGGMQAAADLSAQGFQTIMISHDKRVEKGNMPEQPSSLKQQLQSELVKNGAKMLLGTKLISLDGTAGSYEITIAQSSKSSTFTVGAIVLDLSALTHEELPEKLTKAIGRTNNQRVAEPVLSRLPGIFLCGLEADDAEALIQGSAAAAKASIFLNRGTIEIEETVATVNQLRCRGCGTCVSICPFAAVSLCEKSPNVFIARVDEGLCRGCGMCVAHCPSGALTQNGYSDGQLTASLEAILS